MSTNYFRSLWRGTPGGILFVLLLLVTVAIYSLWLRIEPQKITPMVGIVVPDGMSLSAPALSVWLDAAHEEGMLADSAPLSDLIGKTIWGGSKRDAYRILILPDEILRQSNRKLLAPLTAFVQKGGHLLVCFDAFTRPAVGEKSKDRALLSDLVGVDYALFDSLGVNEISHSPIFGSDENMTLLQISPGKAIQWPQSKTGQLALTTYQYGFVTYPHFITHGAYSGQTLLESPDGSLVLGEKKFGQGSVMFANLPLGDLKGRTDGLLLHSTLRRLAQRAGIPTLAATPGGIGGLVFNWHIDANSPLPALAEFERRGFFSQGPFSIHLTVGPDAHKIGDHAGIDLEHNLPMQLWVKRFVAHGDALGNHGGWLHDYFGMHVADGDRTEMTSLLTRNDEVLSKVAGLPILEYSAPLGNQPEWVTQWIEKHGVLAYYFTGNTGMGPTRSYRDGILNTQKIWSFPIATLNQIASFEEALDEKMSSDYISQWLISLANFTADTGTVLTFYSHPAGWSPYYDAMQKWFDRTNELVSEKRFHWYTMQRIAEFLNRREQVNWRVEDKTTQDRFIVSDAKSLAEMAWRLPKLRFAKPVVESGNAQIQESETAWTVVAVDGKSLIFNASLNLNPL